MLATDFEYDGQKLSDFGMVICDFNSSSGTEEISVGSTITFNTVSRHFGKKYGLPSTQYDECIETSFSICKDPDIYDDLELTSAEVHDLIRWLNRREFLKMQFLYEDDVNINRKVCYYDASFNISKVTIGSHLYGITVDMITNRPFGYGDEISVTIDASDITASYTITDESEEIGYIYPDITITCGSSGDLSIVNKTESCELEILNCEEGEIITIDGDAHIISSSVSGHELYDDFNFDFLKISNTYDNQENNITVSLPCIIEITYTPIIKDTPD